MAVLEAAVVLVAPAVVADGKHRKERAGIFSMSALSLFGFELGGNGFETVGGGLQQNL